MRQGLKGFAVGVGKIAASLVVTVIALGGIGVGLFKWSEQRERLRNGPLAEKRSWEQRAFLNQGTCSVVSAWREGRLYLQVVLDNYNEPSVVASHDARIYITFLDSDDFRIFRHEIGWNEFTRAFGRSRREWKGDTSISADNYRRSAGWSCAWAA
jgi:hypothetical protein